ncbi:hypothetical protein [uncultured Campylobacter sp.]|nr:hypothetical protein [uncultured Campylobacter sp.]
MGFLKFTDKILRREISFRKISAAIFKFMRPNFTDLREPPFAADLLPV